MFLFSLLMLIDFSPNNGLGIPYNIPIINTKLNSLNENRYYKLDEETRLHKSDSYLLNIGPPHSHLRGNALILIIKCTDDCDVPYEIYEVVEGENGDEHKIPRHRIGQTWYVGARNSGFLVWMKTANTNRTKLHIHYTYSINTMFDGVISSSCPFPIVHLENETDVFRPTLDHIIFECGVKIIGSSNVLRFFVYERFLPYSYASFIMTPAPNPFETPEMIPLKFDMEIRRTENVTEMAVFDSTVAVIFQNSHKYRQLSKYIVDLIGNAPKCECGANNELFLNKTTVIIDPIYPGYDDKLTYDWPICYHVTCTTKIHLDDKIGTNKRLLLWARDALTPSIPLTDGNVTIENTRTRMESYSFNAKTAIMKFNAIVKYNHDLSGTVQPRPFYRMYDVDSLDCECPTNPVGFGSTHFESIFSFKKRFGRYEEARIGRHSIYKRSIEPLMLWFHRDGDCEYSKDISINTKGSTCECELEIHTLSLDEGFKLYSPGYGSVFSYCPEMNCTHIFHAPEDSHIVFTFHTLCIADDTINIYFGPSKSSAKKTLTGCETDEMEPDVEVDTGVSNAIFNFRSDEDFEPGLGYAITVTALPIEKEKRSFRWWEVVMLLIVIAAIAVGFMQRGRIITMLATKAQEQDIQIPLTDSGNRLFT